MIEDTNEQASLLIVEDHHETQVFLGLALDEDYEVDTASSALEALDKSAQNHYDLLLVDIALRDDLDGIELVERLRTQDGYEHVPMIAMTAHQLREDRQFYLDHGFDEYLAKPFFPKDLLALIEELLAQSKSEDDESEGDESRRPRP